MLGSLLLPIAEASACPTAPGAWEISCAIDISGGPLSASIAAFSEQTGLSVGFAGDLPRVTTRRVAGRMSPAAALDRLLRGTGLRARRVGTVFRIERAAAPERKLDQDHRSSPLPSYGTDMSAADPEIVVTAQKRREDVALVPVSMAVVPLGSLASGPRTPSGRDISLGVEGLAMTNLGPGRNRLFIRGVADSAFNGKSQSTVATVIDDARITFDAPDPDIHLIDVERVEVLKGPQGPLYGSGALGGIYHIVTRRPDFDRLSGAMRVSAEGVEHGALGGDIEAVANIPLTDDRLALRGAAYRITSPGWIDNRDGRKNSNITLTAGARLSLRWRPADNWTIDAGAAIQDIDARDSQYVQISEEALTRSNDLAEPADNDFRMAYATVEGEFGNLRLISATSFVNQGFDYVLDATEAAAIFGLAGKLRFADNRRYSVANQELRLSPSGSGKWLLGASFLRATTAGRSMVSGAGVIQDLETLDRSTTEIAIFGERSWRLFRLFDATLGARLFRSASRDIAAQQAVVRRLKRARTLISPNISLSMPLDDRGIVYLRYARAKRPGGLAPAPGNATGEYQADKLGTFDLGFRRAMAGGRLSLSASAYLTRWARVQSNYLLANGLVATRNAGDATIIGMEAGLNWQAGGGFAISTGGTAQRARLTRVQGGAGIESRRIPIVPALTGRASITKAIGLSGWAGQAGVHANYIGRARLSFDPDLDRAMGGYADVAVQAEMSRGAWTVSARMDNILDIQGDSFSFGNPFSIRQAPQFTPVRPRSLLLSLAYSF